MLHRLEICIVPRNANSRRVMAKLAIREEGIAERYLEINGTWEDHVRYGFTVEEWETATRGTVAAWYRVWLADDAASSGSAGAGGQPSPAMRKASARA